MSASSSAPSSTNPLVDDAFIDLLLYEHLDAVALTELPAFADHSRETFDLYLAAVRRFAREELFPTYRPMDQEPPVLRDGTVVTHPSLPHLFRSMVDLGVMTATRPESVGGQQLPQLVATLATVLVTVAMQLALIYVPALNRIFATTPLSVFELTLCVACAAVILVAVEAEKYLKRRDSI